MQALPLGLLRLHREGRLGAIHAHRVSLQALADFSLAFAPPGKAERAPTSPIQDPAA